MLSYYGEIKDGWDKQNDDEYYQRIVGITFNVSKVHPIDGIELKFNIHDKRECDNFTVFSIF